VGGRAFGPMAAPNRTGPNRKTCQVQSHEADDALVNVFGMGAKVAGRTRADSASKHWSIPSKLTLAMVPIAVVTLLLGIFLVWSLATSGDVWLVVTVGVVVGLVVIGSLLVAHRMGRVIGTRIGEVSMAARRVAHKDIVDLLDALRTSDPGTAPLPPLGLDTDSGDEIGDLSRSFVNMHRALIDTSARQMESLRVGVSSILVTLARRNSSLVDRQLALLDELESREEDPVTLGGYYQVDHLAARMRRNAESLLVLAGAESPRLWAKATDISDVVRAALSEVDEYQRVELLALEPARLSAGAVTDVAHLLAELFENSVQFSPPTEPVRVTGLFDVDGYELSISDRGVGMSDPRLAELNRILERPPALGLSVEPTMGIYVVAKLAHRHGLTVKLIRSVPGITVRLAIPRERLETAKADEPEHEVIDLTQPEMIEPASPEPIQVTAGIVAEPEATDLPVRIPGRAFREEKPAPSVAAGDGGGTLRSALMDYNRGRSEAEAREDSDD
jgi:hypothetical protein